MERNGKASKWSKWDDDDDDDKHNQQQARLTTFESMKSVYFDALHPKLWTCKFNHLLNHVMARSTAYEDLATVWMSLDLEFGQNFFTLPERSMDKIDGFLQLLMATSATPASAMRRPAERINWTAEKKCPVQAEWINVRGPGSKTDKLPQKLLTAAAELCCGLL
ncbi:hypothetical protein ACROYT_G023507 [Oculina patagonica]